MKNQWFDKLKQHLLPRGRKLQAFGLLAATSLLGMGRVEANVAPTVQLTTSPAGTTYKAGAAIQLEAVTVDADGYAASVEFYSGGEKIGESNIVFIREPDAGAPLTHSYTWAGVAPGMHRIVAKAIDNLGTAGESKELIVEVVGGIVPNKKEPTISSIQLDKEVVLVTGEVPAGILKVTLESKERIGGGAWQPRAVQRLEGNGGTVTFKLGKSSALELLRLRADSTDPLPASFYAGKTTFGGPTSSVANVGVPGGVDLNSRAEDGKVASGAASDSNRSVVESDIWKIEGDTLYFFNQYKGLQVIDITNPDVPSLQAEFPLPAVGEQMYVLENGIALLLARNGCSYGAEATSEIIAVNTVGGTQVLSRLKVPGTIEESRLVGTALYVASQQYRPMPNATDGAWEWGSVVTSIDFAKPAAPVTRTTLWYSGWGNVITATDRFLFVATRNPQWNMPSSVRCIDISNPDGTMVQVGAITPSGIVQDKFKMNLNGEVLTVISERWDSSSTQAWQTVTRVETYSLAEPKTPTRLGSLEIARGERLFATRFDGDRVYVVTFLRIDPLWIVDLSNPSKPTISGELHVPGWSTYIQPFGDKLVAIGIDNTNGWRVGVSLFDVTDVKNPKLSAKVPLGENYSWSEANQDEKAFTVLPQSGLILVPYQGYTTNGYAARVQLIDMNLDAGTLKARGVINQAMQPRRATEFKNRILSISGRELVTVDAADRDNPVLRSTTTLSWPVNRIWIQGQYQVQLDEQTAWSGNTASTLRVVDKNNTDKLLSVTELNGDLRVLGGVVRDGRLYLARGRAEQVIWAWDEKTQTSINKGTNSSAFRLTIFDLSALPRLTQVGEVETDKADPGYANDLTPHWLSEGVLMWSGRGSYWGPWFRGDVAGMALDSRVALPWWGGGSSGSLITFDVSRADQPKFLSKTTFDSEGKGNYWNFSEPMVQGNLVFASYQTSDFVEGVLPAGQKPPEPLQVKQPDGSIVFEPQKFGMWIQRYYLSVVDFTDAANPTPRKPVNVPGILTGISHDGAIIYTTGNHWNDQNVTDWSEWLDVVAYDGVSASLVTSFQLPQEWPHPVTISKGIITLGRPGDGKTVKPTLESWRLGDGGRLARLWSISVSSPAQSFARFGNKVIVQGISNSVYDTSNPESWRMLGTIESPGCYYYFDLNRAVEDGDSTVWVPLHDYGIRRLDLTPAQP